MDFILYTYDSFDIVVKVSLERDNKRRERMRKYNSQATASPQVGYFAIRKNNISIIIHDVKNLP